MLRRAIAVPALIAAVSLSTLAAPTTSAMPVSERAATKVKDLVLTLTSTQEPETGQMVTFDGTGPASLSGLKVVLRRQVASDGEWVKVTETVIGSDGTFTAQGVATGVGVNRWQVQAVEKVGTGRTRSKIKHSSETVSTNVFAWYYLTDGEHVDESGSTFSSPYSGSVAIGGKTYPKSIYAPVGETAKWREYNLSYRCKTVESFIGVTDDSETGFGAVFSAQLDGSSTSFGQLGLGPAKKVSLDTTSRLRIRLEFRAGDGVTSSGEAAFGDARALCSAEPA